MKATHYSLTMQLPDLENLVEFSIWLDRKLRDDVSYESILDALLNLKTPIRKFRASLLLCKLLSLDKDTAFGLLRQVYLEGEQVYRDLALVTHTHLKLDFPTIPSPPPADETRVIVQTALYNLDAVKDSLRSSPPHVLNFELEWRLLHAYQRIAELQVDNDEMEVLAARLVGLAEIHGHPHLINQARSQQANVMMRVGRYSESAQILFTEADRLPIKRGVYPDHLRASYITVNLMNLGATARALQFIESALEELPDDERLHGRRYWLSMISGLQVNPQPPEFPAWGNDHTQSQVLYHATLADLKFPTNTVLKEHREHLHHILAAFTVTPGATYDTDVLFVRWLRGRTRLALHEYGLAVQELSQLPTLKPEELLNRLLINSLILEIGMSPAGLPAATLEEAEANLHEVFGLARQLPYAEPQSLARIMMRWHPHAAAYCALSPHSITELEPMIENVLKTDKRTTWRAQAIPPGVASFLTRRALRVPGQPPRLSGNFNSQLKRLRDERHALNVFGPLIPPLPVALALLRRGHAQAAGIVLQQFGVHEQLADDAPLLELVEIMRKVTQDKASLAAVDGLMAQLR